MELGKYYALDVAAVGLRLALLQSNWWRWLQNRVEIVTPANSFRNILGGILLREVTGSAYSGDDFHEPLVLLFFSLFVRNATLHVLLRVLYIGLDLVSAHLLGHAVQCYITELVDDVSSEVDEEVRREMQTAKCLPTKSDAVPAAKLVRLVYLLSPFSVLPCVALTSTTIQNFLLSTTFWAVTTKRRFLATVVLGLAAYQTFYPIVLVSVVALRFADAKSRAFWWDVAKTFGSVFLVFGSLLFVSSIVEGSWEFLWSTYGFLFTYPTLTPNVGLFWYFFTEVFDHFRPFFLWVFQLNFLIYWIPLTICLRHDQSLLFCVLVLLTSIFKPYPSIGDAAVCFALLPAWRHFQRFIRHGLMVGGAMVGCFALAPVMWHLWIYAGSANANFYFAITLLYNAAQIFLLTDLVYTHLRLAVHKEHGLTPKIDDKETRITLT